MVNAIGGTQVYFLPPNTQHNANIKANFISCPACAQEAITEMRKQNSQKSAENLHKLLLSLSACFLALAGLGWHFGSKAKESWQKFFNVTLNLDKTQTIKNLFEKSKHIPALSSNKGEIAILFAQANEKFLPILAYAENSVLGIPGQNYWTLTAQGLQEQKTELSRLNTLKQKLWLNPQTGEIRFLNSLFGRIKAGLDFLFNGDLPDKLMNSAQTKNYSLESRIIQNTVPPPNNSSGWHNSYSPIWFYPLYYSNPGELSALEHSYVHSVDCLSAADFGSSGVDISVVSG